MIDRRISFDFSLHRLGIFGVVGSWLDYSFMMPLGRAIQAIVIESLLLDVPPTSNVFSVLIASFYLSITNNGYCYETLITSRRTSL